MMEHTLSLNNQLNCSSEWIPVKRQSEYEWTLDVVEQTVLALISTVNIRPRYCAEQVASIATREQNNHPSPSPTSILPHISTHDLYSLDLCLVRHASARYIVC